MSEKDNKNSGSNQGQNQKNEGHNKQGSSDIVRGTFSDRSTGKSSTHQTYHNNDSVATRGTGPRNKK